MLESQLTGEKIAKNFDLSSTWVSENPDLRRLSEPIPLNIFTEEQISKRDLEMEFRVVTMITERNLQVDKLIEYCAEIGPQNRYKFLPCNYFLYEKTNSIW